MMVTFMMANELMTKLLVMGYIIIQMEQNMKGNEKMINKMELEKKYGRMRLVMKVGMKMGKNQGMDL